MLNITVPKIELFDDLTSTFSSVGPFKLQLEHSLVSISKWESITHKAFLGKQEKTNAEMIEYIKCMNISQNINSDTYTYLTPINLNEIKNYINAPMSATKLPQQKTSSNRDTITSELIYYWMVSLNIPFECQKWHLSRLLALIQVCNIKNTPPKKRSSREILAQNKAINDARRAQLKTTG